MGKRDVTLGHGVQTGGEHVSLELFLGEVNCLIHHGRPNLPVCRRHERKVAAHKLHHVRHTCGKARSPEHFSLCKGNPHTPKCLLEVEVDAVGGYGAEENSIGTVEKGRDLIVERARNASGKARQNERDVGPSPREMLVGLGEFAKLLGVGLYFVHEDAAPEPPFAESIEHNAELCLESLDLVHLTGDADVKRNAKGANAHVADMGLFGDCGAARREQTIKNVMQH